MAIRTALLNGNNITRDTDFSKYIESVSEPGVIEGLTVTPTKVAIGKGRVPCERTNGDTIFALVSVTSEVTISGNGDVFIQVSQTYIDNGELANEDGTGIATIQVGTMPAKNALKLATINNGVVTDARNMIPKVGELNTYIQSLNSRMNIVEQEIDQIIEDKAVDHLEETGLVGEKYTLANTLFKQLTPTLTNSTVDCNVGDLAANTAIHIQRIANGTASNKLKLKVKKIGSPTTGLVVEVRRGVQVDVSDTEAYWYGNELVCSGSIAYSAIDTTYAEIEVTMNGQFGGTKGELLDIVVYQTGSIVNSTNYYAIACDSTQYSEGFSLVAVNGTTRTRSKLMPYCIGDGFAQSLLCKTSSIGNSEATTLSFYGGDTSPSEHTQTYTTTETYSKLNISVNYSVSYSGSYYDGGTGGYVTVQVGATTVISKTNISVNTDGTLGATLTNVSSGTVITVKYQQPSNVRIGAGSYQVVPIQGTVNIQPQTKPIPRPLIATEIKSIGEQSTGMSYGRKSDGTRYGEFDENTYTSATTGSVTLGNCVGFKIITDSTGEQYKIPIYGL